MFNDDENKPFLQYDELGFIIGLKQTGRDISKIDKTTEEIRDILLGFQKNLEQSLLSKYSVPKPKLSALEQALIDAQIKPVDSDDLLKEMANPIVQATLALDKVAKTLDDLIEESIPELKRNRSPNVLQRQAVELDSPESVLREFSNRGNEPSRDNSTAVNQQTETTRAVGQAVPKSGASAEQIDPIQVQRERDSRGRFIDSTAVNQQTETTRAVGQAVPKSGASAEQIDPIQVQRERDSRGRFIDSTAVNQQTETTRAVGQAVPKSGASAEQIDPIQVQRERDSRGRFIDSTAVNQQTETTRAVGQAVPKSGASAEQIDPIQVQRERDSRGRFIDSTAVNQQTETTRAVGQAVPKSGASAEQIDPIQVQRERDSRGRFIDSTAVNQQTETTRAVGQAVPKSGASAEQIDPIQVQRERDSRGRFIDSTAVNQQTETTRAVGQAVPKSGASAEQIDPIQVQRERDSRGRFIDSTAVNQQTETTRAVGQAVPKSGASAEQIDPIQVQRERDSRGRFIDSTAVNQQTETTRAVGQAVPKSGASAEQIDPIQVQRERDSRGRFIGGESESKSTLGKIAQTIGTAIKGSIASTPQGVDPTVDAINEVATVLSPVKRAAGFMLRPLTGLMKSRKRNEPLPKEQADHNRKQVKLLQRIADNNSGGGILGSLIRMLPMVLGAIAGIGGVIAAGFTAAAPVIAAAVGGAIALLAAGKGKEILDNLADKSRPQEQGDINPDGSSNKGVVGWVNRKAKGFMNGVRGTANSAIGAVTGNYEVFDDGTGEYSKNRVGLKTDAIDQDGKYLYQQQYGGKGVNDSGKKVAQFGGAANSNSQSSIKKIITPNANRSNTVELRDGSIVKRTGNRNWRNNNPGNIEYGELAKKYGAIGSDGRFAIFPDYASGRKAKEHLIFESNRAKNLSTSLDYGKGLGYKDKTLKQTIAAYAPIEDSNDTNKYQKEVLAAVNGQNKKMSDYSPAERKKIMDAMEKVEGYKAGETKVIKSAVQPVQPVQPSNLANTSTPKSAIAKEAETIIQKAKPQSSVLSTVPAVTPLATRQNSLAASYTPPKLDTKIEPAKEYLTSPAPQEVVVKNQNSGTINQNVSNRILAHAITGGLGMGDKWNV